MFAKILAGVCAALILAVTILWFDGQAARSRAETAEASLSMQGEELVKANRNNKELNDAITLQKNLIKSFQEEQTKLRKIAHKREIILRSIVGNTSDVTTLNGELREALERIQGFRFEGGLPGEATAAATSDDTDALRGMTYIEFAKAAAINLGRCADAIETIYKPPGTTTDSIEEVTH